jgi:hypothetical protein
MAAVRSQWRSLSTDAHRRAPILARELDRWVGKVLGPRPEAPFTTLDSYPLVHLPIWAAPGLTPAILALLVRSTISGYLYVRLIDNVYDADTGGAEELRVLPAASFLHTEFQLPYQQLYPFDHPFWDTFTSAWTRAAEATLADRLSENPDVDRFELAAARKTTSAIIPVAAALYAGGDPCRMPAWVRFVDAFGCWHQLENDFFGWQKDQRHGNPNLLLGEARRRGADPDGWFFDEGFEWAAELLSRYAGEAAAHARSLHCPELVSYMEMRLSAHHVRLASLRRGISEQIRLNRLLATFGRPAGDPRSQ